MLGSTLVHISVLVCNVVVDERVNRTGNDLTLSPGGCGKAEHLKKKKIFGPKVFDFFGQIIFRSTFYKNKFV